MAEASRCVRVRGGSAMAVVVVVRVLVVLVAHVGIPFRCAGWTTGAHEAIMCV